jgi:prepilin-type N-terminal cleavage/methylation domain-containing protein
MRRPRLRAGFTLVEMVVVLLILAALAAATVPALRSELAPDDELTAATRTLEAVFRLARDSAARGGAPVTVVIDSVTQQVWFVVPPRPGSAADDELAEVPERAPRPGTLGRADTPAFEPGAILDLPRDVRLEVSRARARFTITPHGLALGDSLTLRRGASAIHLTLDPWTADVLAF